MKFLSVCSGIESASVAWEPLGWEAVAFSEIEPFPSAVLEYHWPYTPNLGDMTKWADWPKDLLVQADILVGGTPCQAFSVAGLRKSLDDERGNLTLIYAQLLQHLDSLRAQRGLPPVIAVWENVPGVLNTKDNAFGCFLAALAGEDEPLVPSGKRWTNAGYVSGPQRNVAWRIIDAQYFGVAQRRRRVFVVASARNGFCPGEVLFEPEGVRRDSPPSREAEGGVAGTLTTRTGNSNDNFSVESGHCVLGEDGSPRWVTPTECERLQGFPDGHTLIPWRGKPAEACPDGPRYKALGNSKAVPCVKWIGNRIAKHLP